MNFTEDSLGSAVSALAKLQRGYALLRADALSTPDGVGSGADARGVLVDESVNSFATKFFDALDDDMNTAGAVGILFDCVAETAKHSEPAVRAAAAAFVADALGIFGLKPLLERPAAEDAATTTVDDDIVRRISARIGDVVHLNGEGPEAAIAAVIDARNAARRAKDFSLGDRLRDALAAEGIVLKDGKDGTTWTLDGG